jgi:hypothetical protein
MPRADTRDDVGFQTAHRVSFKTSLTDKAYPDPDRVAQFYDQLSTRLAAVPGVRRLGAVSYVPMSGEGNVVQALPETPAGAPSARRWSAGATSAASISRPWASR